MSHPEREFLERFALALSGAGMQRMAARVLAAFMLADRPTLTMPDLGAELGVSAGAVSGALKMLDHLGLVERAPVPGSRRDHYRLREDAWYEASAASTETLVAFQELATDGIATFGGPDSAAGRRLAEMREFYAFMERELPAALERWRAERDTRRATG